ncbi:MAG TPA: response regulator transcription factor [Terriglobales bacterium]|jgi:DNA-binding NarL/FixJ family response regulator
MSSVACGIDVFLLAENRLLREALTRILNKKIDIRVVGSAPFFPEVISQVAEASPQVLLFDCMPFALADLGFIPELRRLVPGLKVVLIGMEPNREIFLRSVREGVVGYVLKDASALEVAAAVRAVMNNEAVCPPSLCLSLFDYVSQQPRELPSFQLRQQLGLTRREQQLVKMIGQGLTNKEIASQLNVAEQTVKNHVHRMLRKVGASDRLAVVEVCRIQGWVS